MHVERHTGAGVRGRATAEALAELGPTATKAAAESLAAKTLGSESLRGKALGSEPLATGRETLPTETLSAEATRRRLLKGAHDLNQG